MIKNIFWTVVFGLIAAMLQSTLLSRFAVYRAVPDIALGIIVYSAYIKGVMGGQLSGFFYGITFDFISSAPLGLNALIRTVIGALAGLMKGKFFLDFFLLPMTLCASATIVKALLFFILSLIFSGSIPVYSFTAPTLWVELGLNTAIAPFLFAFLKCFKRLFAGREEQ